MTESDFTFEGQKVGEKVLAVNKMHPLTLFGTGVKLIVGTIVVLIILRFAGASLPFFIASSLFLLTGGYFAFRSWYIWNNTFSIVTNLRVIQVEQGGVFRRKISESSLDKIQNISHETNGVIQTLFDFGNIKVETAGMQSSADIVLRFVPQPYEIQQIIVGAVKKYGGAKIELSLHDNSKNSNNKKIRKN